MVDEIERAETGSLGTEDRTAPLYAFTGKHTFIAMSELLVLAKEIANLTTTYADVACRNVLVRTDIAIELVHERLAEAHDFGIAATAGREVRTTLGATHRQRGERVLECLLEAQELHNRKVDRGMET